MTIPRNLSFLAQGASSTGVLSVPYGGTGVTSMTAGYIPYGNGTGAFNSSSNFTFNGTSLGIGTSSPTAFIDIYSPSQGYAGIALKGYVSAQRWNLVSGISGVSIQPFAISISGDGTSPAMCIYPSGGVSIGNTTDAGATNLSVQGNVGVGTATPANSLNIVADNTPFRGQLSLQTVSASNLNQFSWYNQTVESATIYQDYSDNSWNFINIQSAPITFFTTNTERMRLFPSGGFSIGNTTDKGAASLNVSGLIFPQQAATASAPAYQKGAIYFDTTLNKLRVGGATAWETITSI